MFFQMMPEISGTSSSSPFVTSVSVSGALVHCGVVSCGETALLLALPAAKCGSTWRTSALVRAASRVIEVRHGSLKSAFESGRNKLWLDELFGGMLLEELLDIRTVEQVSLDC